MKWGGAQAPHLASCRPEEPLVAGLTPPNPLPGDARRGTRGSCHYSVSSAGEQMAFGLQLVKMPPHEARAHT